MAFPVNFYSFTKEVNSTAQPVGSGTVYQCLSNSDFDILAPRLPMNLGAAANPSGLNYCRVPAWSRYYWIRWAFEGGLWVAYGKIDPLASWKTQIGQTSAYVLRASAASDGSIIDNMYPTKATPSVSVVSISKPWNDSVLSYDSGQFYVGVISHGGATKYWLMTASTFTSFCDTAFDNQWFEDNIKDAQAWMTRAIFDPMQYLASVTWFPGIVSGAGLNGQVYLGYWNTGIYAKEVAASSIGTYREMDGISVTLPKHPQAASRGSFLNSAPYSKYTLDMKPFGRITLDSAALAGETTIVLRITVDYLSGVGTLRVCRGSDDAPIYLTQAQFGVQVQVSQVLRDYFNGAMNVASSAVGAVGSLLTGNVAGAIQGGLSAISGAVNAAQPDVNTTGINGGFGALSGSWKLTGTFYSVADEDNAHRGRPLCQVRQLSTLPGYQLCTDTDLQLPCTRDEMDIIRGYLESGYYFE